MKKLAAINISTEDIELVLKGFEDLHQIHLQNVPEYYTSNNHITKKEITDVLTSNDKYILKLPNQKKLKGFIFCRKFKTNGDISVETIFVEGIYIYPQYRKKGYGFKLYTAAEIFFQKQDVFSFSLNVWSFNTSARNLYEKIGFKPVRIYYTRNNSLNVTKISKLVG